MSDDDVVMTALISPYIVQTFALMHSLPYLRPTPQNSHKLPGVLFHTLRGVHLVKYKQRLLPCLKCSSNSTCFYLIRKASVIRPPPPVLDPTMTITVTVGFGIWNQ